VNGLLRCEAETVTMVDVTVASSDYQVDCGGLLRPECKVKRIVAEVVALEHLIFEQALVFSILVFAAANLDLGAV